MNLIIPKKWSNFFLLVCSLFFYFFGEGSLAILLILSICFNYFFGILIHRGFKQSEKRARIFLFLAVVGNLSLLFYYKYFVWLLRESGLYIFFNEFYFSDIVMPIGISFFTFQGISYLVDIFRREVSPTVNILDLGLYISFFPQLIAGPIIKYHDIDKQIRHRELNLHRMTEGIRRFIIGLVKKIVFANNFAIVADSVFASDFNELASASAWLGIICFALQIYFDFSGYSDMAIGLAKIMGFEFKENFNYPYISRSIQEFWRRWHISLSTWLKEYVYIPLGGNRKGKGRMLFNLFIVFVLTGIWHGASYNFLIWGLIHGTFLILEKVNFPVLPSPLGFLKNIYVLFVVVVAWVFFKIESLDQCFLFLKQMFIWQSEGNYRAFIYLSPYFLTLFLSGIILTTPIRSFIGKYVNYFSLNDAFIMGMRYAFYLMLFAYSIMELSSLNYNPFIYYRF